MSLNKVEAQVSVSVVLDIETVEKLRDIGKPVEDVCQQAVDHFTRLLTCCTPGDIVQCSEVEFTATCDECGDAEAESGMTGVYLFRTGWRVWKGRILCPECGRKIILANNEGGS